MKRRSPGAAKLRSAQLPPMSRQGSLLIGPLLAGAWRPQPPHCSMTADELACVTPLIISSGAAPLAWARISRSPLAEEPAADPMRHAMRRHAMTNAAGDASLARITGFLNQAGITPLIFKGWAVAPHYASPHLRPYGDFDLLAMPSDRLRARKVLTAHADPASSRPHHDRFIFTGKVAALPAVVDFHSHLPPYYATPSEALFARARPVILPGGETLLKPCPEDHLRIVILHFFKHGGWRPLWLCDIAAMAETAGQHFDWDLCCGEDAAARSWIEAGLAVAGEILGCSRAGRPLVRPPRWLVKTILREWQAPYARRFRAPEPERTLRYVVDKIASYWLNPISSSLLLGHGPSPLRPLHHQIVYSTLGMGRALTKSLRASDLRCHD